jgi:hypothetical protein
VESLHKFADAFLVRFFFIKLAVNRLNCKRKHRHRLACSVVALAFEFIEEIVRVHGFNPIRGDGPAELLTLHGRCDGTEGFSRSANLRR